MKRKTQLLVIGGGCAGMAAALAAREEGIRDILILERAGAMGGVLHQCIHNGFGLHTFGEDLTGTEFARRYIRLTEEAQIPCLTGTIALELRPDRSVLAMRAGELLEIDAEAVILATGCRERSRGALSIPGTRPAGVVTAGTAQRYLNLEGYLVGRRIVILGSGDIGLIMARQFVLAGAEVLAIAEIMPKSGGLPRNLVQCVEDYDIPLFFNTTVSRIYGKSRVEGVELSAVDGQLRPVPGSGRRIDCDTLMLSVGLIPENELAYEAGIALDKRTKGPCVDERYMTSEDGVFSCGNSLFVHDLVDNVALEGKKVGAYAAAYLHHVSERVRADSGRGDGERQPLPEGG